MSRAQPSETVRESMNHDVAASRGPVLRRSLLVLLIRIGNMNRLVKAAPGVATIEDVVTLRSLMISLLLFGANRVRPRATS